MRMRYIFLALLVALRTQAQTEVSGNVDGVWMAEGNPYNVVGAVTVLAGHYLTIMPGVEVRFTGYFAFTVLGGMCAWGNAEDSVKFKANTGQNPGSWKYIEYREVTNDSTILRFCLIECGDRAVHANSCGVTLEHCLIRAHGMSPVKGTDAEITLISCTVTDNGGSGLSLDNTAANLLDCSITYSGGTSGRGINSSNGGSLDINGGYIGHNTGAGIYGLSIASVNLQNVEIAENGDSGVELTLCTHLAASRAVIHDNDLHGIFLSSTPTDGRNLTISSNQQYGIFCSGDLLELTSSIVDRNGSWGVEVQSPAVGDLSYNDYFNNSAGNYLGADPGTGSIEIDPLYENYATRNFNLQTGSPCVDTGNPNDPSDPDGTRTDMGAFYFDQTPIFPPEALNPSAYALLTAYPNPFNLALNIRFQAAHPGLASLQIWTAEGRFVADLWKGLLTARATQVIWTAEGLASGSYYLRLEGEGYGSVLPCALIK